VQHWFLPQELYATSKGSWKKAVVLMPTAETCLSVWNLNGTGEVVAAAVLHGILAALSEMHSLGFLHGDVKPDNFLLVPTPKAKSDLGLPVKIVGIDLGRAIDVRREPAAFQSKQHIDPYRCPEMKNMERWMYQIDCYGAAATAFGMIFDDFTMKVESAEHAHMAYYRLKKRMPAEIENPDEMWESIFGCLLNGTLGETSGKAFHLQRLGELQKQLGAFVNKRRKDASDELLALLSEGPRD
jgi:serine/threonine protein kinase